MNKKFEWKNIKKTDWIVLALIGAILLVIALPDESSGGKMTDRSSTDGNSGNEANSSMAGTFIETQNKSEAEKYAEYLEEKLEDVLREMEGVGKAKVMITLSDYGESVIEKDTVDISSSVNETDSNGGNRDTFSREIQSETVRVEQKDGSYPYVGKEMLPTIEGIVVVAEGGGNAVVVSQISRAAMALFPIEAHKIIVVKMSQGG